jgi:protein O-mannosyl-transferase
MQNQIFNNKYSVLLIFSTLTTLLYLNCFSVGLLSDDFGYFAGVEGNSWSSISKNFNDPFFLPLSHIIQLIIFKLFGINTVMFHGLQLIFHILCGWQLFLLVREVNSTKKIFFAFCCGVFFLTIPYSTETVIWLAAKGYVFSLFFALLSIRFYYKNKLALCCLFIISSIFCKEMGYIIPIVIFSIDYYNQRIDLFKKRFILLFSIVAGCLLIRFLTLSTLVGGYGESIHMSINLFTIPKTLGAYLLKYLTYYRYNQDVFISLLIFFSFFTVSIPFIRKTITNRNYKAYIFISLAFITTLLPVITLEITSLFSIQSDRYGYFNTVVVAIIIASIVCSWEKSKKIMLFFMFSIAFIFITYNDSKKWVSASGICSEYLDELSKQDIDNKKVLLINAPDNYKGVYVLRNGIKEFLELKRLSTTINVLYLQKTSSAEWGLQIKKESTIKDLKLLKNKYDLILLFNKGYFKDINP